MCVDVFQQLFFSMCDIFRSFKVQSVFLLECEKINELLAIICICISAAGFL